MNSTRMIFLVLITDALLLSGCGGENVMTSERNAQEPAHRDGYLKFDADLPGLKPKVFAANLLYGDNAYPGYQSFNEAGDEFIYAVTDREWQSSGMRMVSARNPSQVRILKLVNEKWEGEPFVTDDGRRIFFTAIMPPKDIPWHSDIYYADKIADGWGRPHLLPSPINTLASEWHVSLTRKGVMYFCSERDGGRLRADLFRAVPENGEYKTVKKLPDTINTAYNDCDPLIAPDESYLIFHSNRPGGYGEHDLYISFRNPHGEWSVARNMGPDINTSGWEMAPSLTPDGKYLLFTRRKAFKTDEPSQIFWVSARIVDTLR